MVVTKSIESALARSPESSVTAEIEGHEMSRESDEKKEEDENGEQYWKQKRCIW